MSRRPQRADVARDAFRAMGTTIEMIGPPTPAFASARRRVMDVFEREERRFSRFRGDSELTTVNRAAGRWTDVSGPFGSLVRFALRQAERTDGLFDPAVLDAVIAAGYDRDFDDVLAGARGALHPSHPCGRWRDIEVREGAIRMPDGVGLDLGGVAKGWTADLAAESACREGPGWVLVNAGGDLRIAGNAPVIDVAIEDPGSPDEEAVRVRLDSGAVATSSTAARAWGEGLHHVIDPRTGRPATTPVVQASVWAQTCAEAEVLATWCLLTGPSSLDRLPGALVTAGGEIFVSFEPEEVAV